MHTRRRFLVASLLAGAACNAPSLAQAPPARAAFEAQAQALLASRIDAAGPGVAVLVARGDELLFRGARGMASIELGVPLSADHVFRIGSVTKQFAAAALLQRVDAGVLKLEDPLSSFLPDYPNGSAITVAQLLNHTSGVKSYTGIPGYMTTAIRADLSTAELVNVFKNLPADFAPGSAFAYNNSGYVLVGAVLEAVAKMPWHQTVRAMVAPLGLQRTVYGANESVVAGMADGYSGGADGRPARAGMLSMTQPHAAGALLSTVDDLWRWNRALHGGQVLKADTHRRMLTPEGAAARNGGNYGFGIMAHTLRGEPLWHHGGGIHGYTSSLLYAPQSQLTVVVLRNSDGPGLDPTTLARQLGALALGRPFPDGPTLAVPAAQMRALEGVYRKAGASGAANERLLRVQGGVLTSQRSGGAPLKLRPIALGTWLFEVSTGRIEFPPASDATSPVSLRFFADGDGDGELWQRVADLPPERPTVTLDAAQLQALVGQYSGTGFSFRVFIDAQGVLRGQAPGQPALQLHAESARRLFVREVDARFEFEGDSGPAPGLLLLQGPARLQLQRVLP
jgi:CubicO group peptidase (beta-lactamase class C family)